MNNRFVFRHFAGGTDAGKLNVAVYNPVDDESIRVLIPEDGTGTQVGTPVHISATEYTVLREEWTDNGKICDSDVNITIKALEFCDSRKPNKIHGLCGKPSNASKDEVNKATKNLNIRCKSLDMENWECTADSQHKTLSRWVIESLNNTSGILNLTEEILLNAFIIDETRFSHIHFNHCQSIYRTAVDKLFATIEKPTDYDRASYKRIADAEVNQYYSDIATKFICAFKTVFRVTKIDRPEWLSVDLAETWSVELQNVINSEYRTDSGHG